MVGGLRCVVIHVKCNANRLRGYGAVEGGGVENGPSHYFGQWLIQQLVLPSKPRYVTDRQTNRRTDTGRKQRRTTLTHSVAG